MHNLRLFRFLACVLAVVLASGCRGMQLDLGFEPRSTPTTQATLASQVQQPSTPAPAATTAPTSRPTAPPTTEPTSTAAPTAAGKPTSRPEVVGTPQPTGFVVMLDGQPLTAENLPAPDAYYNDLLARNGRDYKSCYGSPTPQPGACPKPASLGSIELKQQINVELILDASGSMAEKVGGEAKIDIAKRVLNDFIDSLPKNANVALRVYGHKGTSADVDKAVSCASSELVYPFQPLDKSRFTQAINGFQASGWTPIGASFDAAREDMSKFDPANSSNFVYVITDGLETCDGDPVAAAHDLHAASVQPIVNIVGFDIDPQATQQLRDAAQQGGGQFYTAGNAAELNQVFKQFDWDAWTNYYNCVYDLATNQYNAVYDIQTNSFNCTYDFATHEFDTIYDEANNRFDMIYTAANDAYDAYYERANNSARSAAAAQKDALINRAVANRDYAIHQGATRRDTIIHGAAASRTDTIAAAQQQRLQAIQDAARQRQQMAGQP